MTEGNNPLPVTDEVERASERLGDWMSAALDDPSVCEAMKADIQAWFDARAASASLTRTQIAATELAATDLPGSSVTMSSQTGEAGAANLPTRSEGVEAAYKDGFCEGFEHRSRTEDPLESVNGAIRGWNHRVTIAALKEGASRD